MGRDKRLVGPFVGNRMRRAGGRVRQRVVRTWGPSFGPIATGLRGDHRSVLVLADPAHDDRVRGWRRHFSGDDVTILSVGTDVGDLGELREHLRRRSGPDLILVVLGPGALTLLAKSHLTLFRRLFLYLGTGGRYVVDRRVAGRRAGGQTKKRIGAVPISPVST